MLIASFTLCSIRLIPPTTYPIVAILLAMLSVPESLDRWYLLINGEDIWIRTQWCDRVRVDLPVALGVMVLDVGKFSRLAKSLMVPVQVANPSEVVSDESLPFRYYLLTCANLGSHF